MKSAPIFLGGLSHSGKTPLRIALDAHSRIAMTRRTYMWTSYYGRFGDLAQPEQLDRCLDAMMREEGIRELDPDMGQIRRDFARGEATYGRLFALFHEQHAARIGKARWGDQLGLVEAFADRIFESIPGASVIHMIRDPRNQSSHSSRHVGRLGWLTARWLFSADLAERNRKKYPDRYRVVRYETLAAEPEATLRSVANFLGEDYEPQMLAALPNQATGSAQWLPSRTTTAFVQRYASDRLDALGYVADPLERSRLGAAFYVVDWPANRAAMLAWGAFGAPSVRRQAQR